MPGLHLALAALVLQAPCADTTARAEDSLPWRRVIRRLDCERTQLADELTRVHAVLKGRATTEAPALLARIEVEPPRPRPTGYGLLPELTADAPEKSIPLTESRFSLEALSGWSANYLRDAATLSRRAASSAEPLEPLVTDLELRRRQLRFLESTIAYHRFWQQSAAVSRAFFANKNLLVVRARELQTLERAGTDSAAIAAFRNRLAADVAPFTTVRGLGWTTEDDGSRTLPVDLVTDITDDTFLASVEAAIERHWNQSKAAHERQFRIFLRITRVTPGSLYPEGAPAAGSQINEANHVARFAKGALILTTGASSTHAYGPYVQLGTSPLSARVLAHEFGHLLGFNDGYLRGTEGKPEDAWGVVFVEWTGILDDLMGEPGSGRTSGAMIEQLIIAYPPQRP